MSWTWSPAHTIGVNAADQRANPFVMDHTRERLCLPWKSKSKKAKKLPGVAASTAKTPHFVMDLIHDSNLEVAADVDFEYMIFPIPFIFSDIQLQEHKSERNHRKITYFYLIDNIGTIFTKDGLLPRNIIVYNCGLHKESTLRNLAIGSRLS